MQVAYQLKANELDMNFLESIKKLFQEKSIYINISVANKEDVNIVKLDTDVMKFFPDSKSVNEALRTLIKLMSNSQNSIKLSS